MAATNKTLNEVSRHGHMDRQQITITTDFGSDLEAQSAELKQSCDPVTFDSVFAPVTKVRAKYLIL